MKTFLEWKKNTENKEMYNFENWEEMRDWFEKRTKRHISLVSKYCKKIESYDEERFGELSQGGVRITQMKIENKSEQATPRKPSD
jgi:CTP synthase (UTP-ammonia lyase)